MLIHKRKKDELIEENIIPKTDETPETKVSKPRGERRFRPIFDKVSEIQSGMNELKVSQAKLLSEIEKLKITDKEVHKEIEKPIEEKIIPE